MASTDLELRLTTVGITRLKVDAIFNAANTSLLGGDGVTGDIRAAGPEMLAECRKIGGCRPTGKTAKGTAYKGLPVAGLACHPTVGPLWKGGGAGEQQVPGTVIVCALTSLDRRDFGYRIPCNPDGSIRFPRDLAARVAVATISSYLAEYQMPELVIFACLDAATLNAYHNAIGGEA